MQIDPFTTKITIGEKESRTFFGCIHDCHYDKKGWSFVNVIQTDGKTEIAVTLSKFKGKLLADMMTSSSNEERDLIRQGKIIVKDESDVIVVDGLKLIHFKTKAVIAKEKEERKKREKKRIKELKIEYPPYNIYRMFWVEEEWTFLIVTRLSTSGTKINGQEHVDRIFVK